MPRVDVLLVSLGGTTGLREADAEFAASLRRAGAGVEVVEAARVREWRTFALIELAWARSARRAAQRGIAAHDPRAVVYSSSTAALLWPRPGAIRFDAPAAGNRPGRHGLWQRPAERRRFTQAPILLPWSEGALAEAPSPHAPALVVPMPVEASAADPVPIAARRIAAVTYGANPDKKGLDRVLEAWSQARREGEELVVAGLDARAGGSFARQRGVPAEGVRWAGLLDRPDYRALVRDAKAFVTAPRREDYGIAQLEALADGTQLVTTPAPGPYAALPSAGTLDPRLVSDDLVAAIRTALDDSSPDYARRAAAAVAPWSRAAVDRLVVDELLGRLLG